MDYELPEPDLYGQDGNSVKMLRYYTADTLRAEVAKAEKRGRDDMQRECTALCMTSWATDAERTYGQELAEAIRSLE